MEGNNLYKLLKLIFPKLNQFGVTRYSWDTNEKVFVVANNKLLGNKIIAINTLFLFAWLTFYLVQIRKYIVNQQFDDSIFLIIMLFLHLGAVVFNTMLVFQADNFFSIFNTLLRLLRWITRKFLNTFRVTVF